MIIAVNFQLKQPERRSLKNKEKQRKKSGLQGDPVEAMIFFRLLLSGCLSWKFTAMIIL